MADRVYFSAWLRGFNAERVLPSLEKVLRLIPYSRLRPDSALTVFAVGYTEPSVLDVRFDHAPDPAEVIAHCQQFDNPDCAYQIEAYWDLWAKDDNGDWKLSPAPLSLTCYGPEFASDLDENVRLDFGLDAQFLPQTDSPSELTAIRSNIRSLLHLTADLGKNISLDKKLLWSENGSNLADQLRVIISGLND